MLETFVVGVAVAVIVCGTPALYKLGKKKKTEAINSGKVYYGILWCRILALFLLALFAAEMILMAILGKSGEGPFAFLITFVCSLPITALFVYLYRRRFIKKYLAYFYR